ncbi:MAG: hypothetical protein WCP35_19780 [Verrucomicrobiota bacterium]
MHPCTNPDKTPPTSRDFSINLDRLVSYAMQAQHHKIEIDAHAAFRKIGINLDGSPIGAQCVDSLRKHLTRLITTELLIASLRDASKMTRTRRGKPSPVAPQGEPQTEGGTSHES